jgi:hypothetical protein
MPTQREIIEDALARVPRDKDGYFRRQDLEAELVKLGNHQDVAKKLIESAKASDPRFQKMK